MSQNEMQKASGNEKNRGIVEIDLLELFYRLLEKVHFIILIALVGALLMGVYSFYIAKPVYEATSKLYVMSSSDSVINLSDLQVGATLASDYTEVFNTWEVQEQVLQSLELPYTYEQLRGMLTIANPSNSRVLYITVASGDPEEAMNIANEYAKVASKYIAEMMHTDEPSMLSTALKPIDPVSPRKTVNVILGFLLGAMLMAGVITVQYLMDDKYKTTEDLSRFANMTTLAVIPINEQTEHARVKGHEKKEA